MRKKHEVQRDLTQALNSKKEFEGKEGKEEELERAIADVQKLTQEMNSIIIDEAAERALAASQGSKEMKETAAKFSFGKFIRQISEENVKLDGVELEMAQEAVKEAERSGIKLTGYGIPYELLCNRAFTGQNVSVNADGGYLVNTELRYQEALRNRLVLAQAGANFVGGLVGNIRLVEGDAITLGWLEENEEGGDTKKQFKTREIGPKRAFVNVPISAQLIRQSSFDVEAMITSDIMNGHAELLDTAALLGTGADNQPLGILNDPDITGLEIGANGGEVNFGTIVDLESEVAYKNADVTRMAYITNSKVRGAMKKTLKSEGVAGYNWENNEVNGYPAYVTNILKADIEKGTGKGLSPMIFGNFADLSIFQWGGLDLISDPYTLKKRGAIEITLNAYHNIFIRRKESFAVLKDIKA